MLFIPVSAQCRLVMEDIVWRQPLNLQEGFKWLDTVVRMIGNYKTMAGFLMVSAYIDSGYKTSTFWGRGDAITLLAYLQMIWVLDPLVYATCSLLVPDRCSASRFDYSGVHRWYLLAMLWIKLAMMALRVARLPPFLQCVIVTTTAFVLPPEMGCLTMDRCDSSSANDPALWRGSLACDPMSPLACTRQDDGLRTLLAPLWRFLFQGPYVDSWSMFSSSFMRYYLLFAAIYFWTFHYGRPATAAALALAQRLLQRWPSPPMGKVKPGSSGGSGGSRGGGGGSTHSTHNLSAAAVFADPLARGAALVGLVAVELTQSALLGPGVYNYLQENFAGTYTPQLLPTLGVLVLLVLAVLLLVAAIGPNPQPPRLVRLAGSTTLGCYVVHMYFTFPLSFASPLVASLPARLGTVPGLLVQLAWMLGMPMLFQLTIGVLGHWLLMWELKLILRLTAAAWGRIGQLARDLTARAPTCPRRPSFALRGKPPPGTARVSVDAGVESATTSERIAPVFTI